MWCSNTTAVYQFKTEPCHWRREDQVKIAHKALCLILPAVKNHTKPKLDRGIDWQTCEAQQSHPQLHSKSPCWLGRSPIRVVDSSCGSFVTVIKTLTPRETEKVKTRLKLQYPCHLAHNRPLRIAGDCRDHGLSMWPATSLTCM
jgi:hypothetical protein